MRDEVAILDGVPEGDVTRSPPSRLGDAVTAERVLSRMVDFSSSAMDPELSR